MGSPFQLRVAEKRLPHEDRRHPLPLPSPKLTGIISDDMCRQNHVMPGHLKRRRLQLKSAKQLRVGGHNDS
jgi:hypothetical protein